LAGRRSVLPPVLIALALGACGKADNAAGPGGVSVGEAKALDEAAAMVEAQRLPAEAIAAPAQPPARKPGQ
jgi:hypothetical protein